MSGDFSKHLDETYLRSVLQNVEEWLRLKHGFQPELTSWAANSIKTELKLRPWRSQIHYRGVNYDDPIICSGYLYRYAFCHAALSRHVTHSVLTEEPNGDLAKLLADQKCLKIVSVGGGPGNDLLGFCCAMKDFATQLDELHMTLVDLKGGWKDIFYKLMSEVKSSARYWKLGEFFEKIPTGNQLYNFVQQDLCDGVPTELGEADLVLMVKVLSNVSPHQKVNILRNIFQSLKRGALFFYIDIDAVFVTLQGLVIMEEIYVKYQHQKFSPDSGAQIGQSSYEICILKKN